MSGGWAAFWTPKRQRAYSLILLSLAVFWCSVAIVYVWTKAARADEQYGSDFVVYYSAGSLALTGQAADAYELPLLHREEQRTVGDVQPFPWYYPPQFQLVLAPLALLPYPAALALWLAGTAAAMGVAMRRVVWPWSVGLGLAAFVPVMVCVGFGQNGMLTAALLGGVVLLVDRRPGTAGVLLGLLTYKPQFLIVAGLGLILGRRWRVLGWAGATAGVLVLASVAALGLEAWRGFVDSLGTASDSLYQRDGSEKMPGVLAAGVTLGLPRLMSQLLHGAVALPCLLGAAWTWKGNINPARRNAATALATVIVSPYAFVYDLAVLVLVAGWLTAEARERGRWRHGERLLLALCVTAPLWSWFLAEATSVQLGWLALVGLLAVVVVNGTPWRGSDSRAVQPATAF